MPPSRESPSMIGLLLKKRVGRVGGNLGIFHLQDKFCGESCLGCFFTFHISKVKLTEAYCTQPFITLVMGGGNIWNDIGIALKGLVFLLKEALVLACLLHWAWLKSGPPLLDKCKAFSVLSTSCCPVSVQWLFFPASFWGMGGQHLRVDDFDEGVGCRFLLGSLNYSSDYFGPFCQLRSAFGGTEELSQWGSCEDLNQGQPSKPDIWHPRSLKVFGEEKNIFTQ